MNAPLVDATGMIGAVLTTVCWVPQAWKIIRSRETQAISLAGTLAFTVGIAFCSPMAWRSGNCVEHGDARADGADPRAQARPR
jgi:MtN3 and saliva related transmembrane protein